MRMLCPYCNSDDLRRDAYAEWDPDIEGWVLHSVYDNMICMSCDAEFSRDEVKEVTDE